MRILIDLQGAQSASRHRGIGRYTLSLALAMAQNPGDHEILLLLNGMLGETIRPIRDAFKPWVPAANIHVWHALAPVNANDPANASRRHIAALIREEAIRHIQPDVVHITSLYDGYGDNAVHSMPAHAQCPVAVTFYDAIPLIHAAQYLDTDPIYRSHYLACTAQAQSADLLLAISESSRQEAIALLHTPAERVVNISSAVDAAFKPLTYTEAQTQALQHRLGIHKPYVMYSGATDERKNHRGLIEAFGQLPAAVRNAHQLVLAGGLPPDHRKQLEAHARVCGLTPDDVVITGRISDAEMIQLYNQCALYVFASWHEGFGLPALEAMACGAATIGANTTSVPEVIGWERALFDPHQASAIAQKMAEALTDATFHSELKAHATKQAALFSWDASAQRVLQALETLHPAQLAAHPDAPTTTLARIVPILAQDSTVDLLALSQALARNQTAAKPQLLVDISELVQRDARTGIQRVVRSILGEWLSNPPEQYDVQPVYSTATTPGYCYANSYKKATWNLSAANGDAPIDFGPGDVFLALDMQPQVQIHQAPFLQHMRDLGVDVRFVLYDLLPITMPQHFPAGALDNYTRWVRVAASTDGVICISRAVADEFNAWLAQHASADVPPKVDWFHMGADIQSSKPTLGLPADAALTLQALSALPTFLVVGTLEPRKGHAQVLDAMEQLWQAGVQANLAIVGKQGWAVDQLVARLKVHPKSGSQLFWFEGVSDEYLEQIYAASSCLIAASYGEGFGLPLIEAAQQKLPIIARDIAVFREVAGDHALYFDGPDPSALSKTMSTWLSLHAAGKNPTSHDMPWQSWKQSAAQLLRLMSS